MAQSTRTKLAAGGVAILLAICLCTCLSHLARRLCAVFWCWLSSLRPPQNSIRLTPAVGMHSLLCHSPVPHAARAFHRFFFERIAYSRIVFLRLTSGNSLVSIRDRYQCDQLSELAHTLIASTKQGMLRDQTTLGRLIFRALHKIYFLCRRICGACFSIFHTGGFWRLHEIAGVFALSLLCRVHMIVIYLFANQFQKLLTPLRMSICSAKAQRLEDCCQPCQGQAIRQMFGLRCRSVSGSSS